MITVGIFDANNRLSELVDGLTAAARALGLTVLGASQDGGVAGG